MVKRLRNDVDVVSQIRAAQRELSQGGRHGWFLSVPQNESRMRRNDIGLIRLLREQSHLSH